MEDVRRVYKIDGVVALTVEQLRDLLSRVLAEYPNYPVVFDQVNHMEETLSFSKVVVDTERGHVELRV